MSETFRRVTRPEDMNLSGEAILRFFDAHSDLGIHSLALVRENQVYALSYKPYSEELPHALFSLSKSFTSMAAGLAIHEGLISLEDSVADVLKSSLPDPYDPRLHLVKFQHLLSMTSGLDPRSNLRSLREKRDWARETLSFPVIDEPGTTFFYNSHGTYLAGRMISERTGQTLRDYLMPRLFSKLGIKKPQWDCCPLGYNAAGFGLSLSVMDLARVGQMLLANGVWQGETVLPPDFLAQATTKQAETADPKAREHWADWENGYGWQFWMGQNGRYRGDGMFGQVLMVDPENNLALAVTAGLKKMGDEVAALNILMDDLVKLEPLGKQEQRALSAFVADLHVKSPGDDGGEVCIEGSYLDAAGRQLRIETPDSDTLRLFYKARGQKTPDKMIFGRRQAHRGEYCSPRPGEGPQPCLGRFGVHQGTLRLQALMPKGAYTIDIVLKPEGKDLDVLMDNVGFESGHFHFTDAGQ